MYDISIKSLFNIPGMLLQFSHWCLFIFLYIILSITSINYHILLSLSTSADDMKIKCLFSTLAYTFIMSHEADSTSSSKSKNDVMSHLVYPAYNSFLPLSHRFICYHHSCIILETAAMVPDSSPLWSVLVMLDDNGGAATITTTATTNITSAILLLSQLSTFCQAWPVLAQTG